MEEQKKKKRGTKASKLEKELKTVRTELKDYRERYLRALADLENYKKRIVREKQEYVEYANANLIRSVLTVLDNFERALDSGKIGSEFQPFYKGVEMIYENLKDVLGREGLQQFSSLGEEFNPERHEAVVALESEAHPANIIVDEIEKGYILRDRIIRPAKVAVSKDKKKEVEEDAQSDRN